MTFGNYLEFPGSSFSVLELSTQRTDLRRRLRDAKRLARRGGLGQLRAVVLRRARIAAANFILDDPEDHIYLDRRFSDSIDNPRTFWITRLSGLRNEKTN